MRKACVLLAAAGLLATACATTSGHLSGGIGAGTGSAGSATLVRLQPGAAVQAEPQARPSPVPIVRISTVPSGRPAPQSRPAQPAPSAATAGPTQTSPIPASPPSDRCVGSPTLNQHQPQPMCAVP